MTLTDHIPQKEVVPIIKIKIKRNVILSMAENHKIIVKF